MLAHTMVPTCRYLRLPKAGYRPEECDDACAVRPEVGRFAVADGASESCFAGLWARLLVDGFLHTTGPQPAPWHSWLEAVQQQWSNEIHSRPLPWYVEDAARQGAFATFLGLIVEPPGRLRRPRWHAVAVGDSCLFHVRQGRLQRAFPINRAGAFGNTPWLLGSRDTPGGLRKKTLRTSGSWRAGDQLWLMTDALAAWCLQEHEARRCPWTTLGNLLAAPPQQPGFAAWVEQRRQNHELRNDDVTVIQVNLESP
jgi:hypothetical protein